MHNPPHPGEVIRELCLEPLGLSITEAAKAIGISRTEMAYRLSKAFDTSPESWLTMQMHYDLWKTRLKAKKLKVKKLSAV